MSRIELEGMEFYAYHGHFTEEQIVGNKFIIDLSVETDIKSASATDNLEDALDYQKLYFVIQQEMQTKSYLLENIANRISSRIMQEFTQVFSLRLKVSKLNPPLGGKIEKVSIVCEETRN